MKQTKILKVRWDDDYWALTFTEEYEKVDEVLLEKFELKNHKDEKTIDIDWEDVNIQLLIFWEVDPLFIKFIKDEEDSDDVKHHTFFVVNK